MDASIEQFEFACYRDFKLWKEAQEAQSMFEFRKRMGRKGGSTPLADIVEYYECHRTGSLQQSSPAVKSEGPKAWRRSRTTGSIRVGFTCSAHATVVLDGVTGHTKVEACLLTHGMDEAEQLLDYLDELDELPHGLCILSGLQQDCDVTNITESILKNWDKGA